jgi:hypothetical protein
MSQSVADLEQRRAKLIAEMSRLSDLRPGCITGIVRRCGKPSCHCAKAGDAGHGPTLRLTYKAEGKTISEALPTPAAVRKAEREIDEFRRYQQISRDFIHVNESICRLRPVEDSLTPQEKNGRSRSSRGRPRSRPTAEYHFRRTAQKRPPRSGSHRNGYSRRHAPGRRKRAEPSAAGIRTSSGPGGLRMRTKRAPSRKALPQPADLGGAGAVRTRLLLLRLLPSGTEPARPGTRHPGYQVLARGAAHDGSCGQRRFF